MTLNQFTQILVATSLAMALSIAVARAGDTEDLVNPESTNTVDEEQTYIITGSGGYNRRSSNEPVRRPSIELVDIITGYGLPDFDPRDESARRSNSCEEYGRESAGWTLNVAYDEDPRHTPCVSDRGSRIRHSRDD